MNAKILARLEKLESMMGAGDEEEMTFFIHFVSGDPAADNIRTATINGGLTLTRQDGESLDDFEARAKASAPRAKNCVSLIILKDT